MSTGFVGGATYDPRHERRHSQRPERTSGSPAANEWPWDVLHVLFRPRGPGLDIQALADSLLRSDAASIAGAPSTDGLNLSARAAKIESEWSKAFNAREFTRILYSTTDFSWRILFTMNPRLALRVIWISRRQLISHYVSRALFGHRPQDRDSSPLETDDFVTEQLQTLQEVIDGYSEYLYQNYMIGAARIRLQQQIYLPRYFQNNEPFIRIDMNRSYYSDDSHEDEPIEISLMAHRSGICLLTFALPTAREFGIFEAFQYIKSKRRPFKKLSISIPIVGEPDRPPSSIESNVHSWQEAHSDLDWIVWQEKGTLQTDSHSMRVDTLFRVYLKAIARAAKREMQSEWVCNTTLFLGPPKCGCNGREEAKQAHGDEFVQLMLQASSAPKLKDESKNEVLKDYLAHIDNDEELWLAPAHAIHTLWTSDRINFLRDLETVEPIESAVLQHRQLQAIDIRTSQQRVKDKNWFLAQEELALGLPEYGRNLLTIITAPEVMQGVAEKLKTPSLYSRLNDRVKVLESIVNTRYSRKQSRRSSAISVIGIAIIVLLLLPRIAEFVEKMASLTPSQGLTAWLISVFHTSDRATFAIYYLAVTFTVLYFAIATVRISRSRFKRKKRSFGFPTDLELELRRPGPFPRPERGANEPAQDSGPSDPPI